MSAEEKEIIADHEAGHALVAEPRPKADRVSKISIIPRGIAALGYTQQQPTEDRYLLTRAELLAWLDVMLGGRVAEEFVFGDASTGAQDDLQHATDLAREMVTRFGMGDALGLATYEPPRRPLFLDDTHIGEREYSDETALSVDVEVRTLLEAAHERARAHSRSTRRRFARWRAGSSKRRSWIGRSSPRCSKNLKPRRWSPNSLDSAHAPDGAARFASVLTPPAPSQR